MMELDNTEDERKRKDVSTSDSYRLTILRAAFPIRKTITFADGTWTKTSGKFARTFAVSEAAFSDLDELRIVLERTAALSDAIVIHGRPKADTNRRATRRKNVHFRDVGHRFVMIDLDHLPHIEDADPALAAEAARELLPPEFTGARCIWNATAGHALKPGAARLRLVFWTSTWVSLDETRAWFSPRLDAGDPDVESPWCKLPDRALWRAVQPVYLGVTVKGGVDPVAQRWGMLDGAPEVQVPADLDLRVRVAAKRSGGAKRGPRDPADPAARGTAVPDGMTLDAPHMLAEALALLGQRDAKRIERDGGRHLTLFNAANDWLDRGATPDAILSALMCWAFPDDAAEADLVDTLTAAGVVDAVDHAARVRRLGVELAEAWGTGDPLDPDVVERMIGDAETSRAAPVGVLWHPEAGAAFGAVDDEDTGPVRSAGLPAGASADLDEDDDGRPATCWADREIAEIVDALLFEGAEAGAAATAALLERPEVKSDRRSARAIGAADFATPTGVRTLKKLLARLRKQADNARRERTEMSINVVQIHASADKIVRVLRKRSVDMFVRGGQLVEVVEGAIPLPGVTSAEGAVLKPVSRTGLFATVSEHVKLLAGPEGKEREVEPPRKITDVIWENPHRYPLRPILRVSEGPMLMPDGTIISAKGYDAASASFITRAIDLPPVPERPTRDDAMAALGVLDSLLDGFEFASRAARSATLGAMLSTTCRNLFDVVPAILFSAPMPGSGKSYLFRLISALAIGRTGALMAAGRDETETEKRLDSLLPAGVAVACIDNVNGNIGGDKLCQIIEQPQIEIRPLGSTARLEFQNSVSMFMTGNNASLSADMVRRTVIVRLDPATDRPENRTFAFSPLALVEADRPRYLAAVFTIMRAWQQARAAGERPIRPGLASFEAWNDGVRSALVWLGQADPLSTMEAGREMDPERQKAAAIFPAWRAAFGDDNLTAGELEKAITEAEAAADGEAGPTLALAEALRLHMPPERRGSTSLPFGRRLGYFLRSLKGRVSGTLRLEAVTVKDRQGWRVAQL